MIFAKRDEVVDIEPSSDVACLMGAMSLMGFGARKLGEAVEILRDMIGDKSCFKFLGISGALVPCGLRKIFSYMESEKFADLVVTTGANVTHDLAVAFGGKHYRLRNEKIDDNEMKRNGYFRIHDLCVPVLDFINLERHLAQILGELPDRTYGSFELLHEIGKRIEDKNSILKNASGKNVPIIVPALTDSIIGLQIWSLSQNRNIRIDPFRDLSFLVNKQFDLRAQNRRSGALFIGGGVPKNFILQSALTADKPLDYFIQIVTDRPEFGGLSGATPDEAKSWGKAHRGTRACTVNCDASIALPLIVSALFTKRPDIDSRVR